MNRLCCPELKGKHFRMCLQDFESCFRLFAANHSCMRGTTARPTPESLGSLGFLGSSPRRSQAPAWLKSGHNVDTRTKKQGRHEEDFAHSDAVAQCYSCYSAKRKNMQKHGNANSIKLLCDALCDMYSALPCNPANLGFGGGALGRTRKVAAAVCCDMR